MTALTIYMLLNSSLEFTSEIIKYSKELEQENKMPIAQKLLHAGLKINTYLYEAKTAIREADIINKLTKAKNSTEETLYWFQQCVKSHYFDNDPYFVQRGNSLIDNISLNVTES